MSDLGFFNPCKSLEINKDFVRAYYRAKLLGFQDEEISLDLAKYVKDLESSPDYTGTLISIFNDAVDSTDSDTTIDDIFYDVYGW